MINAGTRRCDTGVTYGGYASLGKSRYLDGVTDAAPQNLRPTFGREGARQRGAAGAVLRVVVQPDF
jgi:hypothetical protein